MASLTPPLQRDARPLVVGLVGVVAVVLLGTVILLLGNGPTEVDVWWHDLMLAWRTDGGLTVARALDVIGGTTSMIVIGIALVAGFLIARRPWGAVMVAAAMVASEVVTGSMKVVFARPRPADSLSDVGLTSFPSGHTTLAATVAVVMALLLRGWVSWTVAAAWVLVMAWSRTFLAAHWFTDVVGGAILGISMALLVWWALAKARAAGDRMRSTAASSGR